MGFLDRFFGKPASGPVAKPPRRVRGIQRSVLELMCEMGKESHPNEYGAALRAEGGVITELVFVPGMIGGDSHTMMNTWHLPIDSTIVGTVHSHPTPNATPSDADRQFFSHFGSVHIIIGAPYTPRTWRAYDLTAAPIALDVLE